MSNLRMPGTSPARPAGGRKPDERDSTPPSASGLQPRKPIVTIFADASFDIRTKVGGWGAWIKADGHAAITVSAHFKDALADNTHAEVCALLNALHIARARGFLRQGEAAMVQSDSIAALTFILRFAAGSLDRPAKDGQPASAFPKRLARWTRKNEALYRPAIASLREIVALTGAIIVTRHVKGHEGQKTTRNAVNTIIDKAARKAMRDHRKVTAKAARKKQAAAS